MPRPDAEAGDLLVWTAANSVGVPEIDAEHRHLFSVLNRLHRAMIGSAARREVAQILEQLTSYAEQHFRHEEEWMRRGAYDGLSGHITLHDQFRSRIRDLSERITQGESLISIELCVFLIQWLKTHTSSADMKAAQAIGSGMKGIGDGAVKQRHQDGRGPFRGTGRG